MNYRAKSDDNVRGHLDSGSRNATYMGHSSQNKLIELYAAQIRDSVSSKVQTSEVLHRLADESADISVTEQVSISLRDVDESEQGVLNSLVRNREV